MGENSHLFVIEPQIPKFINAGELNHAGVGVRLPHQRSRNSQVTAKTLQEIMCFCGQATHSYYGADYLKSIIQL